MIFRFVRIVKFPVKFVFILGLLFFAFNSNAQPWSYDFGTGTGTFTSSTASTAFLPTPPSGTARVRVGTNPGSMKLVNPGLASLGTDTELQIASNTGSTSTTKFSVYDYTAGKTGYVKFKIAFSGGTNGVYRFSLGDGGTFSDNSPLAANQTFAAIEWTLGASNAVSYTVMNGGGTFSTTGISSPSSLFTQSSTVYQVEVYANNNTTSSSYNRGASSYTLANATWDLWVDGVRVGTNLTKGSIGPNVTFDSYSVNHQASSSTPGILYLDDFEYSNSFPAIPVITLSDNGTQVAAANVLQGANNQILSTFKLDVTTAAATVTEMDFVTGGNYQAADINGNGFKLWYNSTNNFGTATSIGTAQGSTSTGSGDLLFFSSLSQSIAAGNTGYFWVTANIAGTATVGRTVSLANILNADITFASGTKSGSATAGGAQTIVAPSSPTISITGSIAAFANQCAGTSSGASSYTVSAVNLTGNLDLAAPAGFEIKTGAGAWGSSITLIPSGGTVSSTTIDVRFSPVSGIAYSGNITHISSGATNQNIALSGTGITPATPTVSIASSPAASAGTTTICNGTSVTFTATPANLGSGTAGYQWKLNGTDIPSQTSSTYTSTTLANTNAISCVITVTGGCVTSNSATSNSINMVVNALPATPANPVAAANPSCGSTTLNPMTAPGGETYYWQTTALGTSTANNAASSYTVSTSGTYYVRAQNTAGCWSSASGSIAMTIAPAVNITVHPASTSVLTGVTATFSVTASNASGYQWQVSTDGGGLWNNVSGGSGATTASYTTVAATLAMNNYQYRCIVSGNSPCGSVTSNAATLTVTSAPVAKIYKLVNNVSDLEVGKKYLIVSSASAGSAYAMSSQATNNRPISSSIAITAGTPNQISTTPASSASGSEPFEFTLGGSTGAWTLEDPLTAGFLYAASSGSNLLKTQATNDANGQWAITFSGNVANMIAQGSFTRNVMQYNSGSSIFSCYGSASQAAVYLFKEDCTTVPTDPTSSFNLGTPACGSVAISYTGTIPGGEDYYWQTIASGTNTTLPVSSAYTANTTGTYYVRAKLGTCWSTGSASQAVTIAQAVSITSQPSAQSVVAGSTATFSVTATNASSYQWQFSTDNGGLWSNVPSGGTSNSYTTAATTSGMNGYQYQVIVSGTSPCAPQTSNAVILTVTSPAVNTISNQSSVYGSTASLNPTATAAVTSWSAVLPAGLSINTSTGAISGTITEPVINSPFASSVTANFTAGGSNTKNFTWTITPKALTVTGLSASSKVYDGTTTATLVGTASLNGIVGTDAVTLAGTPAAIFNDKNVGTNKAITISGYTLSGADAGNYSITQPTGLTANITVKILSITAPSIASKVYDGSTATGAITPGTLSGFVGTETVTATASGTYADANVGTGKSATVTYVLANGTNGGLATNYSLANGTGTGDITKANPVFTTSTITINVGGTYTLPGANVASTSNGTMTYAITSGGNATLSGSVITGAVIGSETVTVTQAASTNYNAGSTTVTVIVATIAYNTGDYRTTSGGNWHSTATSNTASWETYNGSGWVASAAPGVNLGNLGTKTVYIRDSIFLVGNNTAPNVVILQDGILNTLTVAATFGNLTVKSGGKFYRQGNSSGVTGTFEVEDNATVYFYHTNSNSRSTSIWAGTEKFHSNSNFVIRTTDNLSGFLVVQTDSDVSEYDGACFGNVIFDLVAGKCNLLPSGFTKTFANNLIFRNGMENLTLSPGSSTLNLLNDMTIESTFGYNITYITASGTVNSNIGGSITNNSTKVLRFVNNASSATTVNVTVGGNIQINSGSIDLNFASGCTATVNVKGHLTVASGASYISTSSTTANTIFSGGNIQNVSGAGTIDIYNMEVNKTGGKVNLLRDLQAKISLKMTAGNVFTNANLFELGISTAQKGTLTYASGFVVGKMRRWFNSTNSGDVTGLFPMGFDETGLKNRHSKVEYTSAATAGGHLTVQFIGTAMGMAGLPMVFSPTDYTGGAGFDVLTTENQGYWQIDNESGKLTDGQYKITCTGEGFQTITNSNITLLKRVGGGNWMCPGAHQLVSANPLMPIVARTGVSGWSNFGFGGGVGSPLPVELISFSVDCASPEIIAKWSTASEKNSDYFILQVSRDLENWSAVNTIPAAGNSSNKKDYLYSDGHTAKGISYYRLVQVDYNGAHKIYNPVSTNCNGDDKAVSVYPNPSTGTFAVEWNNDELTGETQLILTSAAGAIMATKKVQANSGTNLVQFEEDLAPGMYYVTIRNATSKGETVKLIVK